MRDSRRCWKSGKASAAGNVINAGSESRFGGGIRQGKPANSQGAIKADKARRTSRAASKRARKAGGAALAGLHRAACAKARPSAGAPLRRAAAPRPRQAAHGDAPCAQHRTQARHRRACQRCWPPAPDDTPAGCRRTRRREGTATTNAGSANGVPPPAASMPCRRGLGLRRGLPRRRIRRGEALVAQHIPPDHILPCGGGRFDRGGIPPYAPSLTRLTSPHEMAGHIMAALDAQRPCLSFVSGMANCLRWQQIQCCQLQKVQELAPFLPYAGGAVLRRDIRATLAEAIRGADWVGVPISCTDVSGTTLPGAAPFRDRLVQSETDQFHHQLQSASVRLLLPILQGRRVLLIGSRAGEQGICYKGMECRLQASSLL